jgi:hypothetical protein
LSNVTTSNETWVYGYNIETKTADVTIEISAVTISEEDQISSIKCEMCVDNFFDCSGVVHHKFIPQGQKQSAISYIYATVSS